MLQINKDSVYVPGSTVARHGLDAYWYNTTPPSPRPAVVFVHGGGWAVGDKVDHRPDALRIAQTFAINAFTINYALGPGSYPDNVHDLRDFIAWVKATPCTNENRVLVVGYSAGGHIAAWNLANYKNSFATLTFDGPIDLTAAGGNPQSLVDAADAARGTYSAANFSPASYMNAPNMPIPTWWDVRGRFDGVVTDWAVARDRLQYMNTKSRQVTAVGSHVLFDNPVERDAILDRFIKANI